MVKKMITEKELPKGKWRAIEGDLRQNGRGEFIEIYIGDERVCSFSEEEDKFVGVTDKQRIIADFICQACNKYFEMKKALTLILNENFSGQSTLSSYAKRRAALSKGDTNE